MVYVCVSIPKRVLEALKPAIAVFQRVLFSGVSIPNRVLEALKHALGN